jgi:hypothetical protein
MGDVYTAPMKLTSKANKRIATTNMKETFRERIS